MTHDTCRCDPLGADPGPAPAQREGAPLITLGVILLLVGLLLDVPAIITTIGIILIVVGLVLNLVPLGGTRRRVF